MKKFLIFLVVVVVVGGAWLWYKKPAAAAAEEKEKPAAKVETAALKQQAIAQTLDVFGVVAAAPSGDRVTAAPYDCVVRKVFVGVGTRVAAGDGLMEIDPSPDARLALDSARSLLRLATKSLAATQERYELKIVTSQDLLAAQQAEQDARLKVASFDARGLGGDGKIIAATAGVVSKLDLTAGALALTGTALVTVSTGENLEARLGVEAADMARVAAGQPVTLVSASRTELEKVTSAVRSAGGALDPVTGAAEVRVPVPAGASLFLGEHVRASIELLKKDALVAPRSAVLPDEDKQVLFTVKDGKAVRHEVTLGISSGDLVEVSGKDLHDGDSVVTLGNYELTDGMAIQSTEKESPEDKKAAEKNAAPAKEAKP